MASCFDLGQNKTHSKKIGQIYTPNCFNFKYDKIKTLSKDAYYLTSTIDKS